MVIGLYLGLFTDKNSVILIWLLWVGIHEEQFSLVKVASESGADIKEVQEIFKRLVSLGILASRRPGEGENYALRNPRKLLLLWEKSYDIWERCKMWDYSSTLSREKILEILGGERFQGEVVLALHTAAELLKRKYTNLETIEIYFQSPEVKALLEKELSLRPQERGYDVLLMEPFYESILKKYSLQIGDYRVTHPLLTYLDLYHYPLRGVEQAQFLAERSMDIRKIFKWNVK